MYCEKGIDCNHALHFLPHSPVCSVLITVTYHGYPHPQYISAPGQCSAFWTNLQCIHHDTVHPDQDHTATGGKGGSPLFHRNNRTVFLTPAGVLFQEYAQEKRRRWQSLQGRLSASHAVRGNISLYCSVTAALTMVSRGFGVGVIPLLVLQKSLIRHQVRVLRTAPELSPFAIGICTINKRLESPLIRAFWETVSHREE